MAYAGQQICATFEAGADLSAKQYYFVKLSAANTVNVCTAITDIPIGILQNKPGSGEAATVCLFGISKVSANGTLAAGNLIGTSADSQADAITAGGTPDSTVYTMGQALEAAAAGDTVSMFLNPTGSRAA